ncbi:hypothetical protein CAI16_18350 [Virgibacillus dokdonensis]|uniref:Uncharacterized protein n=1 Tax=Virgibacillus dokdonensis TaxID=302167 RepID=A0A3E0WH74_9BACI|nr:hypothetical protein CAI16_18350 [Virgibacillus dokdonensis]
MVMAAPFFMEPFFSITLKPFQRRLYLLFFACGLAKLIAGLLSIPFPSNGWYIVLIVSLLLLAAFMMRMVKKFRRENEKD